MGFLFNTSETKIIDILLFLSLLVTTILPSTPISTTSNPCSCPSGTFSCDDCSLCLPKKLRCDRVANCNDGSDEVDCKCIFNGTVHHVSMKRKPFFNLVKWCGSFCGLFIAKAVLKNHRSVTIQLKKTLLLLLLLLLLSLLPLSLSLS